MKFTRRDALVLTAAASAGSLAGFSPALAAEGDVHDQEALMQPKGFEDRPLGPADAPVTVIEYASPTCPHCATFHNDTYPQFKEQYIDTGDVQFLLRPFLRNVLDAVVFMLAATSDEQYHEIIATYFETQQQWATSETPRDAMLEIALQFGFTEESFEAALTNQELFAGMETLREQAVDEFDLTGTPTFYINGKQFSGDKSLEELAAEIDPQLG